MSTQGNNDCSSVPDECRISISELTEADALLEADEVMILRDGSSTLRSKINAILNIASSPTGTVSAFAGNAAPTGYVLCDGSEYDQTAQAALFAVVGTAYNKGDETANHFRVPDLRGRVVAGLGDNLIDVFAIVNGAVTNNANVAIDGNVGTIETGMAVSGSGIGVGVTVQTVTDQNNIVLSSAVTLAGNAQLTFTRTDVLGDTGGAKTHTLTVDEMPRHNHSYSRAGSTGADGTGGAGYIEGLAGATTGSVGSNQAHNNVQPTIILNYIIKT